MKYIDLSHKLNNKTKEYPGDPKIKITTMKTDDETTLSEISGSLHCGTHMDSPNHYLINGKKIDDIELNSFIGKATVLTVEDLDETKEIFIKNVNIEKPIEKIVILKTGWSDNWGEEKYFYENPYLSIELAESLIKNNVKGIVIDTCSVDKYGENTIHKLLLKNDIWIVENITSSEKLVKDIYESYFIPMKINAEASYIRAFVKEK